MPIMASPAQAAAGRHSHFDRGTQCGTHAYPRILRGHRFKVWMNGKGSYEGNSTDEIYFI